MLKSQGLDRVYRNCSNQYRDRQMERVGRACSTSGGEEWGTALLRKSTRRYPSIGGLGGTLESSAGRPNQFAPKERVLYRLVAHHHGLKIGYREREDEP